MSSNGHMTAAKIRASLRHPIIDADGHWLEFGPVVREQLKKIGGEKAVEGFGLFGAQVVHALSQSVADRRNQRSAQEAFWALPTKNTRDRATAMLPRLLNERLEELGLDFTVLYPTAGLGIASCYCGKPGCIETFLSGPGLTRDYHSHSGSSIARAKRSSAPGRRRPPR